MKNYIEYVPPLSALVSTKDVPTYVYKNDITFHFYTYFTFLYYRIAFKNF